MTNRSPTAVTRLPQWLRAGGSKGSDPALDRRRGWRRARESSPRHPPTRAARSPPHLDRAAPGTPALLSPRTRRRSVPAPRRTASPARARLGGAVRRWWSASWLGKIGAAPDSAKLTACDASSTLSAGPEVEPPPGSSGRPSRQLRAPRAAAPRSEERRVGKECRCRRATYHCKKQQMAATTEA